MDILGNFLPIKIHIEPCLAKIVTISASIPNLSVPGELQFIQTKEKHEIDFLVLQKKRPAHLIEVKLGDDNPTKNFDYFSNLFPYCKKIQLVKNLTKEYTSKNQIAVKSALHALADLNLG